MDIGKAFSYVFEDEQWVTSILICGLLMFVPIVGWLAIGGYALEAARNVAMNSPRPLPKWDNFGQKLSLGWNWFVISIVYALPVAILSGALACLPLLGVIGSGGSEEAASAAVGLFLGSFACLLPLVILVALIIQPLIFAATVRYLQTGSLGAALRVGEIITMVRSDLGGWFVLWLLYILCSFVAQLGSVIVIGIIFTLPYSQAVFGHLLGQKLAQLGTHNSYGAGYAPPPAMM